MPFGLKNAPVVFSRIVVVIFKYFIHKLLEVYFDDWTVFGLVKDHIESLKIILERCFQYEDVASLENLREGQRKSKIIL